MDGFNDLKEICRMACHERQACKPGFEAMLLAENTAQMMQVWRQNWNDIYSSKFADLMPQVVAGLSRQLIQEMRQADVFVNENSRRGLVIVCQPQRKVRIGGTARAYVFGGDAEVEATDHAQVYCRHEGVRIILRGYASAKVRAGECEIYDRSFLKILRQARSTGSGQAQEPLSVTIHDQATFEEVTEI